MHDYDIAFDPDFLGVLAEATSEDDVLMMEPMAAHTTFKIGGPADIVVRPRTTEQLVHVLNICSYGGKRPLVVGNGSDLLVSDRGVRGVVVLLSDNYARVRVEGTRVHAEAGALLRDVALAAADASLTGMEPLWGIPASVGGACFMNAGAYGGQTSDVLESVQVYKFGEPGERGSVIEMDARDLAMGYRKSRIQDDGLVVLSATFALAPGNEAMIRAEMDAYRKRREDKQPLELPSAGSTFKRPEGHFAGKLIMDAGLRGYAVGGAQVSEKHCGFVVNVDHATAEDVRAVIEHVQDEVRRQFGVELDPEVRLIGF